jgi:hypothetical protein
MATVTVVSDKAIASNVNGPPLPYGVPVDVDDSDPFIADLIESGTLTVVTAPTTQVWAETTQAPIVPPNASEIPDAPRVLPEGEPSEDWKRADLDSYAQSLGIDPSEYGTKGELMEAIRDAG